MAARGDLERRRRLHGRRGVARSGSSASSSPRWTALYGTGVAAEELKGLDRDAIVQEFLDDALDAYAEREKELDALQEGLMRDLERFIVLQIVDIRWREHLENMDYMREGIHLRGMAQKDPLVEYRNEGHDDVPGPEPRDPRGGRDAALPRRGHRPGRAPSCSSAGRERRGNGALSYEHQSLAGAEAILAAGGTSTAAAAVRERRRRRDAGRAARR